MLTPMRRILRDAPPVQLFLILRMASRDGVVVDGSGRIGVWVYTKEVDPAKVLQGECGSGVCRGLDILVVGTMMTSGSGTCRGLVELGACRGLVGTKTTSGVF